jgi:hypothetical protein
MAEDGLDAVLVWKSENVRYLTSLRSQILAGQGPHPERRAAGR